MMERNEFLSALQSRIAVLEESEQQDILAEYAQHIDMRVAGGLTEQEAIQDFGALDQLAAEILEAYHVNPDYQAVSTPAGPSAAEKCREGLSACGGFFSRMWHKFTRFCRRTWDGIAGFFLAAGNKIRALFHRPPKARTERPNRRPVMPAIKQNSRRAAGWLGQFCMTVLRLCWNLGLLLCALPFALLVLTAFLCLGALVMLLFQGYPLVGVSICCLGGLLCCVGILGLGWSLVWHRNRKEDNLYE